MAGACTPACCKNTQEAGTLGCLLPRAETLKLLRVILSHCLLQLCLACEPSPAGSVTTVVAAAPILRCFTVVSAYALPDMS